MPRCVVLAHGVVFLFHSGDHPAPCLASHKVTRGTQVIGTQRRVGSPHETKHPRNRKERCHVASATQTRHWTHVTGAPRPTHHAHGITHRDTNHREPLRGVRGVHNNTSVYNHKRGARPMASVTPHRHVYTSQQSRQWCLAPPHHLHRNLCKSWMRDFVALKCSLSISRPITKR